MPSRAWLANALAQDAAAPSADYHRGNRSLVLMTDSRPPVAAGNTSYWVEAALASSLYANIHGYDFVYAVLPPAGCRAPGRTARRLPTWCRLVVVATALVAGVRASSRRLDSDTAVHQPYAGLGVLHRFRSINAHAHAAAASARRRRRRCSRTPTRGGARTRRAPATWCGATSTARSSCCARGGRWTPRASTRAARWAWWAARAVGALGPLGPQRDVQSRGGDARREFAVVRRAWRQARAPRLRGRPRRLRARLLLLPRPTSARPRVAPAAALAYERGRVEAAARTLGCPPGGAPCSHAAAVVAVTEAELAAAAAEHLPRPSTLSRIISACRECDRLCTWPNGTR